MQSTTRTTRWRRLPVALIAVLALTIATTGIAFAFNSGGTPATTGPDTITWTGNGASGGVPDKLNGIYCEAGQTPDGEANTPYMHWIFTTDGGDADAPVTLALGGTGSGTYNGSETGGARHFFTPYFTPDDDLTAEASFVVTSTGRGSWILTLSHACDGGEENTPFSTLSTDVHLAHDDDATPTSILDGEAPLGSFVHDEVTLSVTNLDEWSGNLTVKFYEKGEADNPCEGTPLATSDQIAWDEDSSSTQDGFLPQGPLHAGTYGYLASFDSDNDDLDNAGECEPFTILKADTETTTEVHNAAHEDITNEGVPTGTAVHDKVIVTDASDPASGFTPNGGTATFDFYTTGDCTGGIASTEDVTLGEDGTAESTPQVIATPGHYSYLASYAGDDDFNGSDGACEPFWVYQLGKTMGFWGNTNGQARLLAAGYPNVDIGRDSQINSAAESKKVLPSTRNACGKANNPAGTPAVFGVDPASTQYSGSWCILASGNNRNSFNTLASQTLALGYNRLLVSGYNGQTVADLLCTAKLNGTGLSGTSTVGDAFDAAVIAIDASKTSNVQGTMGALNSLLGCLNRETP